MAKQIGIYGGSFDPIHFGHLNLAIEMMEAHHLDEIWFCPTAINPHKGAGSHASAQDRAAMVRLAIRDQPFWRLLDAELNQSGPSYTVDTIQALISSQAGNSDPDRFSLIIGDDAARSFFRWHKADEIIKCARLLVGRRGCDLLLPFEGSDAIVDALQKGMTHTRVMEISSTEVRQRLAKRLYCGHLIPAKVVDYILSHDLYC